MTTPIQKQIEKRLKAFDLTIGELERKAGLGINAVRNIMTGGSKKPSAEILQAIADVFDCTVKDLLGERHYSQRQNVSDYGFPIEEPTLFTACVEKFLQLCHKHTYKPSLKQAYFMICDIYLFSLEKKGKVPDEHFAEWVIKRNM
jgi:transcriptional regulator with XRE-family HTH domain